MMDTWAGVNLGHWAGLGFAAMGGWDLKPVRVKHVWGLAESLNWIEPYDMEVHLGAELNNRTYTV